MKYVHPFIFALCTIIPMEPDEVSSTSITINYIIPWINQCSMHIGQILCTKCIHCWMSINILMTINTNNWYSIDIQLTPLLTLGWHSINLSWSTVSWQSPNFYRHTTECWHIHLSWLTFDTLPTINKLPNKCWLSVYQDFDWVSI